VELRLRYQSDREICATWGAVVIRICDGAQTEIEDLRRVQQLFDELLETRTTIAMLLVFTHGTALPDQATQRFAKESMGAYEERLVISVAVLGLGFWASTMRSALGTIIRVVRRGDVWLEGSVERAITRLTTDLVGIDADALMAVYQELWNELARSTRRAG
jgi:hypothetical protein